MRNKAVNAPFRAKCSNGALTPLATRSTFGQALTRGRGAPTVTLAVARPEPRSRAPRTRGPRSGHTRRRTPYLLIAPATALMSVFLIYPIVSVVYYSLQRYNVTQPWDDAFV